MTEHIALLAKEIKKLEISLDHAKARAGVTQDEIENIENKLRLKRDILSMMEHKSKSAVYAVFWKFPPSEYAPDPEWVQFNGWIRNLDEAIEVLERIKQNPRCAAAKIVIRSEIYEDYGGDT